MQEEWSNHDGPRHAYCHRAVVAAQYEDDFGDFCRLTNRCGYRGPNVA
jgi:hypothetical protein